MCMLHNIPHVIMVSQENAIVVDGLWLFGAKTSATNTLKQECPNVMDESTDF